MFDFDNDGDFDLSDMVEADIRFNLFGDGECPHCGEYIECIESLICPFCGKRLEP